jgi:hypothetical protein
LYLINELLSSLIGTILLNFCFISCIPLSELLKISPSSAYIINLDDLDVFVHQITESKHNVDKVGDVAAPCGIPIVLNKDGFTL